MSLETPFYTFANITYELDEPMKSKYGLDKFIITSKELIILPEDLVKAGDKATDQPSKLVEDFSRGWHDWLGRLDKKGGRVATSKIKDRKWRGQDGDSLCLEVKSEKDSKLEIGFGYNTWESFDEKQPTGEYKVVRDIKGSPDWQTLTVSIEDLQPSSERLPKVPLHQWQWMGVLTLNGKIDEIRKIFWQKIATSSTETKAASSSPTTVKNNLDSEKDDMPELAGKSEEFKKAVRESLKAEQNSKATK